MSDIAERVKRRNELALSDMAAEEAAGHTCGAPHRSLSRGIGAVMENQLDDIESRNGNGNGKVKGRTVKVGPFTFSNLTDVDFFRLVIILLVGYLVLAHMGIAPSRMTRQQQQPTREAQHGAHPDNTASLDRAVSLNR